MKYFLTLILGVIGLTSLNTHAVPVLRESESKFNGNFATIYPDHKDPNLYYFMPNSSKLAKNNDGSPTISLVHWDLNNLISNDGGALLNFVIRPALDEDLKSELENFQQQNPNARLTVIPMGASSILLNSHKSEGKISKLFKKMLDEVELPEHGGVAESEVGVNMLLTELGAKAFQKSFNTGTFNLAMCYEVFGASPTMNARIHMNYKQIYNYFQASVKVGWWIFGKTIIKEVEKLIREGHISIEILGGDAEIKDYVYQIARDLAKTYLTPILTAQPGAFETQNDSFRFIKFKINNSYKEERATASVELKDQMFITDMRCIPLSLKNLKPWKDQIIQSID